MANFLSVQATDRPLGYAAGVLEARGGFAPLARQEGAPEPNSLQIRGRAMANVALSVRIGAMWAHHGHAGESCRSAKWKCDNLAQLDPTDHPEYSVLNTGYEG